jgi:hypothetical protein
MSHFVAAARVCKNKSPPNSFEKFMNEKTDQVEAAIVTRSKENNNKKIK